MKKIFILIIAILASSSAFFVINNPTNVKELIAQYTDNIRAAIPPPAPSAEVVEIANKASFTDYAKELFYRAQPEIISDRNAFNLACQSPSSSKTVELGCYSSTNKIYLLNIADPALHSQIVVTAAHELLHSAYTKINSSDRTNISKLIEKQLAIIKNKDLDTELNQYQISEPGQRDNELHSIIGTEYGPLSKELESYYSKYFTNRSSLVQFSKQFKDVFDKLQTNINIIGEQIKSTKSKMQNYLTNGNFKQYNLLVPKVNNLISNYNDNVDKYNKLSRNLLGIETGINNQ